MPISVSTDPVRPAERQAFWTEAICRSFANVETKPIGPAVVSGHFEFVEIGSVKLVRFDSSPQCYSRDARLVSKAGSDEFMFDFQRRGRSSMVQAGNESTIQPGYGVLYDARRPFEDRLDGPEQRAQVLIVTVPAARLIAAFRDAERCCAIPIPLSNALSRSVAALVRSLLRDGAARSGYGIEADDIVAYLAAVLRQGSGGTHELHRARLFVLLDTHLRRNLAATHSAPALAAGFGVSERTFYRIFADRGTTFERHTLRLRVERFRRLLSEVRVSDEPIARLALACGFADAAHASRAFKSTFRETPRGYRTRILR
jgi:AraC family transcriptional activator of tynA and feaB